MSKLRKIVMIVFATIVATGIYVLWDWYRFATAGEIDPQRGVYGNDHLEIWIDINARMPQSARLWACKTLLDRQAKVMGGRGAMPPYSCQEGFDPDSKPLTMLESVVQINVGQAANATDAQKAELGKCISDAVLAALSPDQTAEVKDNDPSPETMSLLAITANKSAADCRAKVGL